MQSLLEQNAEWLAKALDGGDTETAADIVNDRMITDLDMLLIVCKAIQGPSNISRAFALRTAVSGEEDPGVMEHRLGGSIYEANKLVQKECFQDVVHGLSVGESRRESLFVLTTLEIQRSVVGDLMPVLKYIHDNPEAIGL